MPDTYTANLRALKIETGTRPGTWGTAANENVFDIFDRGLGYATVTLNSTTASLTITDATLSAGQALGVVFTGTPGGTATVTISPATTQKVWVFKNATTDGSAVVISQGSGSNVTIANGLSAAVYADGGGATASVTTLFTHDTLIDFVANEHVDHTAVTLTAGEGLAGGGDISSDRSFAVDIDGLTQDASPDAAADFVMTYDADAAGLKKVLLEDIGVGSGTVTSVDVTSTPGQDGIVTSGGPITGSGSISVALDVDALTGLAGGSIATGDLLLIVDVSASNAHRNITVNELQEAMILSASVTVPDGADSIAFYDDSVSGVRRTTLAALPLSAFDGDLSGSEIYTDFADVVISGTTSSHSFTWTNGNSQRVADSSSNSTTLDVDTASMNSGTGYFVQYDNNSGSSKTVTVSGVDQWAGGAAPSGTVANGRSLVFTLMAVESTGGTARRVIGYLGVDDTAL